MAEYRRDQDHAGPEARIETLAIHGGQHAEPVTGRPTKAQ
jgi:cystathionine gamma-lyase